MASPARPKTVAVASLGTRGDVDPAIALAQALRRAGYGVIFCGPINFEAEIRKEGLDYRPLRVDMRATIHSDETRSFLDANVIEQIRRLRAVTREMDRAAIYDLYDAVKDADAVVFNILLTFSLDIAEALGIPAALYALQPIAPTRALPVCSLPVKTLGPALNRATYALFRLNSEFLYKEITRARATLLNAPPRKRWKNPTHIHGAMAPSVLAVSPAVFPRPDDWPDTARQTGYWFRDAPTDWAPDPELAAFLRDGPQPIYVGFGSMPLPRAAATRQILVEALQRTGIRAVIDRGWAGLAPSAAGDRLFMIDGAPHSRLFPLVAAVVHHGGAGTTATGLRAGRPSLICPVMIDQSFWGRRVAAIDAGPAPLPVRRWTVNALADRLTDLVCNPLYVEGAKRTAEAVAAEDGLSDAVRILRELFGPP